MAMPLIDRKFSRRLAGRHLLRRLSGLMLLRQRDSDILRRKARLDLVYRSLARGFFKMSSTRSPENIPHSYAGNMTYIHLSFGLVGKETRVVLAEKGGASGSAMDPGYRTSSPVLTESPMRAAKPMLTLTTIPTFVRQGDISRMGSTGGEIKGASARDVMAQGLLPAQWRRENPMEGGPDGTPIMASNSAAQVLQRAQSNPQRIASDTKPAATLRSAAQVFHRTEEGPWRILSDTKPAAAQVLPGNQERIQKIVSDAKPGTALGSAAQVIHRAEDPRQTISDTEPAVTLKSAAQILHRTVESPRWLIGDARPTMALRSRAQVLPRVEEDPQRIFSSRRPIAVPDSAAWEQNRGPGGPPLVIRQSPKIDVPDPLSGEDYPAMDYWHHQQTSARGTTEALHPSARMEYAVSPSPPVERESRQQGVVKKEEQKPPAININKLSDRIYSMIESRLKIDRERRGVCG